jgi:dipeptidyl aminopeptidase/acylaminoacyl peptidase
MTPRPTFPFQAVVFLALALLPASPGAEDRIQRALAFPGRTENRVFRDEVDARWLPDGGSFWYRVRTGPGTHEFVWIQAETGERRASAEFGGLGLPEAEERRASGAGTEPRPTRETGPATVVRFRNLLDAPVDLFWLNFEGRRIPYGSLGAGGEREQPTYAGHVWLVARKTGDVVAVLEAEARPQTILLDAAGGASAVAPEEPPRPDGLSPDRRWQARVTKGRVEVRSVGETEGAWTAPEVGPRPAVPFHGPVSWAPDGSAFVAWQAEPVPERRVTLVASSPEEGLQPERVEFGYRKPGDALPQPVPVIFRVRDGRWSGLGVDAAMFTPAFTESPWLEVTWAPDGREFYVDHNRRGHQLYRVLAVAVADGSVRTVAEERSETFVHYSGKTWRHWSHASGDLLWMSERDGWCHLYRIGIADGAVRNRITAGAWPVREVLHVDEEAREVWFLASGLREGEDPYHRHLCRIGWDGNGFVRLTEGDGDHEISFSPDRRWFVDAWSRADHPPVHELRRSGDGSLVAVLERADASALLATGWTMPERFVAKGRDGVTDIHGILVKPSDFDPSRRYPVVEEIYAGPHGAFVPKRFGRLPRQHQVAELGCVVVQIDGMGTNHRGKAFHDVAWRNLKDAGFPDRIAWMRAAAADRPWMDLGRVGIYGGSAGGQNAMRALLDHHDFYRVAVADCGCHDNRMDKIWWNEQWLGWPVGDQYRANSNLEDAAKLEGRLLLVVGELDRNVDPASTVQVVGALQRAGKTFDYMPIIGAGHGAAETPYGIRLRLEYLWKHLVRPDVSGLTGG